MLLYHYTDQNGFMGIVGNTELWATKIHYLNDSTEFSLANSLARDILQEKLATEPDEEVKFRLKRFFHSLDNIRNLNICVCSLSGEGDLLSQWRGYSKQQGGYSIGFDKDMLETLLTAQRYSLMACIYDENEQRRLIQNVIEETLELFKEYEEPYKENPEYTSQSSGHFTHELSLLAPLIKNRSFSEEQEWRLMSVGGITYDRLSFRPGPSMLIPFHRIKLREDFWNLIRLVTVGHTPNSQLALESTRAYLINQFYDKAKEMGAEIRNRDIPEVRNSAIPYRSW